MRFVIGRSSALVMIPIVALNLFATIQKSYAYNEQDFNAAREQLKSAREQVSSIVKRSYERAGLPAPGFSTGNSLESSPDKTETRKLLTIHSDLRSGHIPSGRLLFGRLIHRVMVGGETAPVLIQLDDEQGSLSHLRLSGVARPSGIQGRLSIDVKFIHHLTGRTTPLTGLILDESGAAGMNATVMSDKALKVAGAMASSFISGLAAGSQDTSQNGFGFSQVKPGGRNALLQGVAQTTADQSKRLIDEATSEKPVLIVEAFEPVTVFVQEEVRF